MPRPCHLVGHTHIIQYTGDHRNRLVKVEHRASYAAAVDRVVENAYDYQNRWVRRRLDADGEGHTDQRRIFAYDGNQIVLDFWRNNSQDLQIGHLRQRYLWGPAVDEILAEEAVDSGTADLVQWTLADHLNTVRDIAKYDPGTDMTTVVNHLVYDAFGRVTSESDPAVDSLFLFTARPFDPDTGLQHNLNRWYDASVGRWLSEEPISYSGGMNLYEYCGDNPVIYADPLGLWGPSDHRRITEEAWNALLNEHPEYGKCRKFKILKALQDANVATDKGTDGKDNRQHYCRGLEQDIDAARQDYADFLAHSRTEYINPVSQGDCKGALTRLGHMLHTWQDYYAHSMDLNSPFRGDPGPIKGDPDRPSTGQKPPSWGSWLKPGEHGWTEPATRECDRGANRRARAGEFSSTKLKELFPIWWERCCGE